MDNIRSMFGGASTESNSRPKFNIFRLKGDKAQAPEIYRILPAMKSLASENRWAFYHAQHFGYMIPRSDKPDQMVHKTFACIRQKSRDGLITAECAECALIDQQKMREERQRAALINQGMSEADVDEKLEPLALWLKSHNVDGKWYIGVKSKAGEFGALAIPHKMKVQLDAKIRKLRDEGIEPIADFDGGVWFQFIRSGSGGNMNFSVEVVMQSEMVNGRRVQSEMPAPLSDDDLRKAIQSIPDLRSEIVTTLTADRIRMIVESGGDPETVKRAFNTSTSTEQSPRGRLSGTAAPMATSAPEMAPRTPPPARQQVVAPTDADIPDWNPAPVTKSEPVVPRTQVAPPPAPTIPAVKAAPAKPASTVQVDEMSEEDFLNMYMK